MLTKKDKLYWLSLHPVPKVVASAASKRVDLVSTDVWHQRYGHVSPGVLSKLKSDVVTGVSTDPITRPVLPCHGCELGKGHRQTFPTSEKHATRRLGKVHSDLVGPMHVKSIQGFTYFATFLDDFSCAGVIYYLQSKDQFPRVFEFYRELAENQTGERIGIFHSDRGGEYMGHVLRDRFKELGIVHHKTLPNSPQQNVLKIVK